MTPTAVFAEAELIVKVKEPQPDEVAMLRPDHILFTYLHLAADQTLTGKSLAATGCTAIAYETIEVNRRLPLLEPMSEIAGRMSAIVGSYHLAKHRGGRGCLLGGVPGVAPGRVVVLGGGTAGVNAARVATGIGADVTILEVDFERMRFLDITMSGTSTVYSNEANLAELLPRVDLVIGAVLVPGARAPKLITREMLRMMPRGSVFVDIAVDQGGCAETTRATTHDNPTYEEEGVLHYCVANMPGAYSRTATQALNNVTHPWTLLIAEKGVAGACAVRKELLGFQPNAFKDSSWMESVLGTPSATMPSEATASSSDFPLAEGQADAVVARVLGKAGDDQVAHAGEPGERFLAAAEGGAEAGHFRERAGDQGRPPHCRRGRGRGPCRRRWHRHS
jgi:alanine dehydrogenase